MPERKWAAGIRAFKHRIVPSPRPSALGSELPLHIQRVSAASTPVAQDIIWGSRRLLRQQLSTWERSLGVP